MSAANSTRGATLDYTGTDCRKHCAQRWPQQLPINSSAAAHQHAPAQIVHQSDMHVCMLASNLKYQTAETISSLQSSVHASSDPLCPWRWLLELPNLGPQHSVKSWQHIHSHAHMAYFPLTTLVKPVQTDKNLARCASFWCPRSIWPGPPCAAIAVYIPAHSA
jgi:hypothetical protein